MSTPEKPRPSLDDTIARIDDTIAEDEGDRCEISHITRDNGGFSGSRCPNQALPGLDYCQPHTDRYGVSMKPGRVDDEATAEVFRIVQDDDFARHEREYLYGPPLDVRPRGGITENGHVLPWTPYLQPALDEAARQLAAQPEQPGHRRSCQHDGPPGTTCPGCTEIDELLAIAHTNAAPFPPPAERPGWLARLRRLFVEGAP